MEDRVFPSARRLGLLLLVGGFAVGCAAKMAPTAAPAGSAPATVAGCIDAARVAVKDARAAGAEKRAAETYQQAVAYLKEAEKASGPAAREAAIRAEWTARMAGLQARCPSAVSGPKPAGEDALTRAQAERRRLDERLALLQQALELTETELIRSKARLKGTETTAEASSAIAEARILIRRLGARGTAAGLCQEALAKAEQQLAADNYGAAMFFALKAQDIANRAMATQPRS